MKFLFFINIYYNKIYHKTIILKIITIIKIYIWKNLETGILKKFDRKSGNSCLFLLFKTLILFLKISKYRTFGYILFYFIYFLIFNNFLRLHSNFFLFLVIFFESKTVKIFNVYEIFILEISLFLFNSFLLI